MNEKIETARKNKKKTQRKEEDEEQDNKGEGNRGREEKKKSKGEKKEGEGEQEGGKEEQAEEVVVEEETFVCIRILKAQKWFLEWTWKSSPLFRVFGGLKNLNSQGESENLQQPGKVRECQENEGIPWVAFSRSQHN